MISHKLHLLCLTEFSNHNYRHNPPNHMTEKPFFLFQKRLPKLGHSCEIHQMLSRARRSIAGRIHLLCQEIESPDITGSITITDAYFSDRSGAFEFAAQVNSWCGAQVETTHYYTISFDSNQINSLYSGNKLQPKAIQILIIIKI